MRHESRKEVKVLRRPMPGHVMLVLLAGITFLADTPPDPCATGHACRFWGAIGDALSDSLITDHLLTGDHSLKGLGSANPHGWGLSYFSPILDAAGWIGPAFARGGPQADHEFDARYDEAVAQLLALDPVCAIAHVRYSSGTHTGVPNPHPFWRDGIALAHNGSIHVDRLVALLEADDPDFLTTHPPDYTSPHIDSELFLLYILEQRELGVATARGSGDHGLRSRALHDAVKQAVFRIYDAGALTVAANCLVANGDTLVAVRFDEDDAERYRVRYREVAGSWVVASEPLGTDTTGWGEIPPKHLGIFTPLAPPEFVRIFPPSGPYLVLADTLIDDDLVGESLGNGDGDCDVGERIELILSLRNEGFETAFNTQATLSTTDSLCQILDDYEEYGDIPVGAEQPCLEDFDLLIDPRCPDGHRLDFTLHVECDSAQAWNRDFSLDVQAPVITLDSYAVYDVVGGNGNGRIDPGERFMLATTLANDGGEQATGLTILLDVQHPYVTILQGVATLDTLAVGGAGDPAPLFELEVAADCPDPDVIVAELLISADWDWGTAVEFPMPIGGFFDDMEAGPGGWTTYVVTGGFINQWHLSNFRNYTPGGEWSWKFGAAGGSDYGSNADGALESEPVTLRTHSWLRFRHWMAAETSDSYAGYCYDGGFVEISLDDGETWEQILPVGGYPYLIRNADGSSPFPAETPAYSGVIEWQAAIFELAAETGEARFRFRFGSDDSVTDEGWYIDDVEFFGTDSLWAGADEALPLDLHPSLGFSRPNPGGPGLRIDFRLPSSRPVRLQIFDVGGRVVRTLLDGRADGGAHSIRWDGRDDSGQQLASGSYFYRFEAGETVETRRLVLVR